MTEPADQPLDTVDQRILDDIRSLQLRLDPPPGDLDERVRFVLALEQVDVEVARLVEEQLVGSGPRTTDRPRTLVFDTETRSIMLTIADAEGGRVRVDGWLAPAASRRIELRLAGRFAFANVTRGLAQVVVHPPDGGGESRLVTPSLRL
jgi:hypothetical protein